MYNKKIDFGGLAQLVEQLTLNQFVASSNLASPTIFIFDILDAH